MPSGVCIAKEYEVAVLKSWQIQKKQAYGRLAESDKCRNGG
jgi:hypothetical protein